MLCSFHKAHLNTPFPSLFRTRTLTAPTFNASVVVDAACVRNGSLTAEIVEASTGKVLEGYSLGDAIPFTADSHETTLRWRGRGAQIPVGAIDERSVQVRFSLLRARLYYFSLRPTADVGR